MVFTQVIPPFAAVSRCRGALSTDALFILDELRRGVCLALESEHGTTILRNEKPELVIVAHEGRDPVAILEAVTDLARAYDFQSIRYHSTRPGMERISQGRAELVERIFRRTL